MSPHDDEPIRGSAAVVFLDDNQPTRCSRPPRRLGNWAPGTPSPSYLDGSLAGDYGFDPLGLGAEPANLARFQVRAGPLPARGIRQLGLARSLSSALANAGG